MAICYLRLSLSCLETDEQLATFRAELSAVDGELDAWVRERLSATAVDPTFVAELSRAFPADTIALLGAMLRVDPSRRPTISSLLEHPYLRGAEEGGKIGEGGSEGVDGGSKGAVEGASSRASGRASDVERPMWLAELLEGEDESCAIAPFYESEERPLAVRVNLRPPLGLLLAEASAEERAGIGASLAVEEVIEGYAAAESDKVRVGDRLVSVDGRSVRDTTLEDVTAMLSMSGVRRALGRTLALTFERSCGAEECDIVGTDLDGSSATEAGEAVETEAVGAEEAGSAAAGPFAARLNGSGDGRGGSGGSGVIDAGAAEWLGKRASQEDTHVLTSFAVAPRYGTRGEEPTTYILAGIFDGHRGPKASAFAQAALPEAVRSAIHAGEPSPLAAAWRCVAEGYFATEEQDGSCASAVLISGDGRCEILNCGDCRTVLAAESESASQGQGAKLDGEDESDSASSDSAPGGGGGGGGGSGGGGNGGRCFVAFATRDHAASDPIEAQRIGSIGGSIGCGSGGEMRVAVDSPSGLWQVAVARALGGSEWQGGGISNVAEASTIRLDDSHKFLVVASDGVWGVLDDPSASDAAERSEGVAWRVAAARAAGTSAGDIAEALVRCAEREGGSDNASCIVLLLGQE